MRGNAELGERVSDWGWRRESFLKGEAPFARGSYRVLEKERKR